jgi:hypothetical protein
MVKGAATPSGAGRQQSARLDLHGPPLHNRRAMRVLGRVWALLLLLAIAAPAPPDPVEDRSVPGYCSPDCPLQQVAHAVAILTATRPDLAGDTLSGLRVLLGHATATPPAPLAPDAPRGPPSR